MRARCLRSRSACRCCDVGPIGRRAPASRRTTSSEALEIELHAGGADRHQPLFSSHGQCSRYGMNVRRMESMNDLVVPLRSDPSSDTRTTALLNGAASASSRRFRVRPVTISKSSPGWLNCRPAPESRRTFADRAVRSPSGHRERGRRSRVTAVAHRFTARGWPRIRTPAAIVSGHTIEIRHPLRFDRLASTVNET